MLAVIDNYDSFTFNLVQMVRELGTPVKVYRNDTVTPEELLNGNFTGVIISPGPGRPEDAGICLEVVKKLAGILPILGVCLGHQVIAQALGGRVIPARRLMHGKVSRIIHDGMGIYRGLPQEFTAARYHSLAVEQASLPSCLKITARTPEGEVMGIRHREFQLEGVQFHPESIATPEGRKILKNFISYTNEPSYEQS
ncbi:glutamine amidotransferase of anthranilate synthase [Desulfotomaculum nigrificans CO-1-SRB]|uniref:Glutamine amidotransferase of anthranilate synthase n=1 Tax=Desulfotomaculum nigrificans (strain DSM 14880 / VKM B-2319 / CO-1-SRB) TaxID=868595 RepID=F6B7I4_DESCC|nr:aminodeoxychorismate/anthranilate synthase component II [Desulfotomaculum nigrificans]AEF94538.1 glutamine amidotransferase of anthranilate synthase [Desulfotomaculum nigrificans CO-1-SRB]